MNDKSLEELAKEERLRYFREWRRNNPDKVKKHNENYWLNRAQKRLREEENCGSETTKDDDHSGNSGNRASS